jgi:hypothetical protein
MTMIIRDNLQTQWEHDTQEAENANGHKILSCNYIFVHVCVCVFKVFLYEFALSLLRVRS